MSTYWIIASLLLNYYYYDIQSYLLFIFYWVSKCNPHHSNCKVNPQYHVSSQDVFPCCHAPMLLVDPWESIAILFHTLYLLPDFQLLLRCEVVPHLNRFSFAAALIALSCLCPTKLAYVFYWRRSKSSKKTSWDCAQLWFWSTNLWPIILVLLAISNHKNDQPIIQTGHNYIHNIKLRPMKTRP